MTLFVTIEPKNGAFVANKVIRFRKGGQNRENRPKKASGSVNLRQPVCFSL